MKLGTHFPIRRWAMLLGWPGVCGAAGLAACLALYLSAMLPAQQRLDAARHSAGSLQQRLARAAAAGDQGPRGADEQLAAFYRIFPGEQDVTEWIGRIAAIAARDGLALQQADYKAVHDPAGKLVRLQMDLPLRGEYQTIRSFLSDLRAEIPIVSLEQVQFARQKIGEPLVDSKIRLVIFLGRAS
jgi:Tfp pilus assembly protein PilO